MVLPALGTAVLTGRMSPDPSGNAGHAYQRTELTAAQRDIYAALQVTEPPRFLHLATAD